MFGFTFKYEKNDLVSNDIYIFLNYIFVTELEKN